MNDLKKFLIKLVFITVPLFAVYGFPGYVLFFSGEASSLQSVLQQQLNNPKVLYGPAYHDPTPGFKMLAAQHWKADILSLGTSRVLQFRAAFFNTDDYTFYNAGHGINSIQDFRLFLGKLPKEALPKVLIIGLDQNFFNLNWDTFLPSGDPIETHLQKSNLRVLGYWQTVYNDYYEGKYQIFSPVQSAGPLQKYIPYGMNAIINGSGFRYDGSHRPEVDHKPFTLSAKIIGHMDEGIGRFKHAQTVSEPALEEVKRIIQYCEDREIHLIAFLPPFAKSVYDLIQTKPELHYMTLLNERIEPLFENNSAVFFDCSNPTSFQSKDTEMLDDLHGSEVTYLRMLIYMANHDSVLVQYANYEKMSELLANRINNILVVD